MISKAVVMAMLLNASVAVAGGDAATAESDTKPCRMNSDGIKGGITCERGWLVKGRKQAAE